MEPGCERSFGSFSADWHPRPPTSALVSKGDSPAEGILDLVSAAVDHKRSIENCKAAVRTNAKITGKLERHDDRSAALIRPC